MMDTMREWTNEKHVNFLNSIEASFVRAMFPDSALNNEQHTQRQQQDFSSHDNCLLRLDRFLPDSCDSTQDLPTQKRRSSSTTTPPSVDDMMENNRSTVKSERKTRRLFRPQPYGSFQDQVVPEAELRRRE